MQLVQQNTALKHPAENNMHHEPVPVELMVSYSRNFSNLVLGHSIFLSAGAVPGGGDAYLCCDVHHVCVQTASGTVWIEWAHYQPASKCGYLQKLPKHSCVRNVTVVKNEGANQINDFQVRQAVVL